VNLLLDVAVGRVPTGSQTPGGAHGGTFVPHFAGGGTKQSPGGFAVVGEAGTELVQFGGTAAVFPHNQFQSEIASAIAAALPVSPQINVNVAIDSVSDGNAEQIGLTVGTVAAKTLRRLLPDVRGALIGA
jgi:hypothetical protein